MSSACPSLHAAGLGLRREFLHQIPELPPDQRPDFFEIAPENWIGATPADWQLLEKIRQDTPLVLHGLSLSIGGLHPVNVDLLKQVRRLKQQLDIDWYSEHLSFSDDSTGYLYDLLPLPMTRAAIKHVVPRIHQVQDFLQQPLILENASTYLQPQAEMNEAEFISAIVAQTGCQLLVDVNNVYVNSINHQYDALHMLRGLPRHAVCYYHMAGHQVLTPSLLLDTHGSAVCDNVWQLFAQAISLLGVHPALLERDFDLPPLPVLMQEYQQLKRAMPFPARQITEQVA